MKLSDAIEQGKKLIKNQTRYSYVKYGKNGLQACAIGAAYLALNPDKVDVIKEKGSARGYGNAVYNWFILDAEIPQDVIFKITWWNDNEQMTLDEVVAALRAPNAVHLDREVEVTS